MTNPTDRIIEIRAKHKAVMSAGEDYHLWLSRRAQLAEIDIPWLLSHITTLEDEITALREASRVVDAARVSAESQIEEATNLVRIFLEDWPTHEMILSGARSIGLTIRQENHHDRARDCWNAMIRTGNTGKMPEIPSARALGAQAQPADHPRALSEDGIRQAAEHLL